MALPPLIENSDKDWLFKVTEKDSVQHERDLCLLGFFLGTACTTLEINRIQLGDVTQKSGKLNREFIIRGEKSFNGEDRVLFKKSKTILVVSFSFT